MIIVASFVDFLVPLIIQNVGTFDTKFNGSMAVTLLYAVIATACYYIHAGWYLTMVHNMFLAIYIVEFLLKFYAWRLRYFKLAWNIFDIQQCM